MSLRHIAAAFLALLMLASCGGGSSSTTSNPGSSSSPASGSGGSSGSSGGSGTSAAAQLAVKIGKPARLLVGLGTADVASIQAQAIKADIFDQYLVGADGTSASWPLWNLPAGDYVNIVAAEADSLGAVPMFTLYQMATNGDGNLSGLTNATFMTNYWSNVVLLFQRLAIYDKPALVNFEPDFWGYVQQQAPKGDPTQMPAMVSLAPDCAGLPNHAGGVAQCLLTIARKYAPKAVVGYPPSDWGANGNIASVVSFMNQIGANRADFVVMQTLDRDAGCFEDQNVADSCVRAGSGWYWDETNTTHPNFSDHLAEVLTYHQGIGLPIVWWQTPLGVPAATPGGTSQHWRDNRVHYFLTHPAELTAVGGLGVVFSAGETYQTDITTDGGQFQRLAAAYLAAPVMLP